MAYTTINDPSAHFQTLLYTGDGTSSQAQTNTGNSDLQPDWVWIKKRAGGTARAHQLYDSSRGVTKLLHSNTNGAESTQSAGLTAFGSDGFTVGDDDGIGANTATYVAWQWKANGGTTSSNSDGSITSTVQANTTAGFSVVTWSGNGNTATIGHGLGTTPQVVILKSRDNAHDWFVGHQKKHSTPWQKYLTLHSTGTLADDTIWNDTAPTSTVFSVGSYDSTNGNGVNFVAYVFAEKQGYSQFDSYTGNGNADGPFVYTGFKPAWLLGKRTDGSGNSWFMFDNKRDTENVMDAYLYANENSAETTGTGRVDFLSNGFKWRNTAAAWNGSGNTYIYMAFAEHPFVSSKGVPVTAR